MMKLIKHSPRQFRPIMEKGVRVMEDVSAKYVLSLLQRERTNQ